MFTILPAVPTSVSRTLIPTWMHDILCADLCTFRHQMFSDILTPTPRPQWVSTDEETIESHQPLIATPQDHPRANSMTGALTLNICAQEKSRSNEHPEKPWKEINGKRWLQRAWWVCFHRRQPTVQWLLAISSSYYWMFNTYQAQFASPCVCVCTHAQLLNHMWLFVTPMDCSPPCSSVHGILQARILEGVAILYLHICSQLILITVLQVKYYVPWFLVEEIRFREVKSLTKNHITSRSTYIPLDYDASSKKTPDFLKTSVHNITWLPLSLVHYNPVPKLKFREMRYACVLSHIWLSDCLNDSSTGSSVHGIFQARILEWVAIFSSRGKVRILTKWRVQDNPSGVLWEMALSQERCWCPGGC